MSGRWLCLVALGATLALAACADSSPQATTEPEFHFTSSGPCDFSTTLITNYFPASRQSFIRSLKQSMANAGKGTTGARTFGFQIMDSIGSVSRNFTVSASAGATLTLALIPCMFNNASTFTYPTTPATDFAKALTNADGGAYYVRGGGAGGADSPGRSAAVIGRTSPPGGTDGNLSGLAPSSGSWTTMLDDPAAANTSSEGRALIYGYLVSAPGAPIQYEWATIPSDLTFSPAMLVAVCDNDVSASAMVLTEAVGVLAFANTTLCNTLQSQTALRLGWGPRAVAARLGQMLVGAVTPAPLHATALLSGTGGTTSKIPRSIVQKLTVSAGSLGLSWVNKPPATINGTAPNTFPVSVSVDAGGNAILGVCAYMTGQTNNGTPTQLVGPKHAACTTPPGGGTDYLSVLVQNNGSTTASLADFGQVGITKTGGIDLTVSVQVQDRAGTGSITTRSNVKPKK
jgi:hypothetical protein